MPTNLAAQLFDIDGLLLTKVESDYNTVTLHVEMERQEQPCPECGVLTDTAKHSGNGDAKAICQGSRVSGIIQPSGCPECCTAIRGQGRNYQ